MEFWDTVTAALPWSASIPVGGTIAVCLIARRRWQTLKPELFKERETSVQEPSDALTATDAERNLPLWLRNIAPLLASARSAIAAECAAQSPAIGEAMQRLDAFAPAAAPLVQSVVSECLQLGELKSSLIREGGDYLYALAAPNRYEYPHLIRRYAPFAAGWKAHFVQLRAALTADGDFRSVTAYQFFLNPDGGAGVLLASYADANLLLLPAALTPQNEVGRDETRIFPAVTELGDAG